MSMLGRDWRSTTWDSVFHVKWGLVASVRLPGRGDAADSGTGGQLIDTTPLTTQVDPHEYVAR